MFYMQGQEIEHADNTFKKIQLKMHMGLIGYGDQGVVLPPFMFKLLPSAEYNITKKIAAYASPGISLGAGFALHFETGLKHGGFTVDYSTNSFIPIVRDEDHEDDDNTIKGPFPSNGNINIGYRFRISEYNLLWFKIGKSISNKGYDEGESLWNGNHIEVRIILPIS